MPTYLNWETGLGQVTLDTNTDILIPAQPATYGGTTDAIDFLIKRLGDPQTGTPILDGEGNVQYIFNDSGSKVPSGYELYKTTNGADDLWIRGAIPGGGESLFYALNLTTIRLGDGDDSLRLYGEGISQSNRSEISLESTAGYIFQSNIFAGGGNDYISALLAWQSTIKGGSNQIYYDALNTPAASIPVGGIGVTLGDDLTLEELPYGDTLVFRGSRADWDLEFVDGNNDGSVSLASLLDETDYIASSNNNKIYGFERLLFGDYLFDLVLYKQQPSSVIYGQPEYFLFGEETAPTLNSSTDSDLWGAFRFNRTKIGGIEGAGSLYRIVVRTGSENDTPYLDGFLAYADLYTEAGNDITFIQNTKEAILDLGLGNDQVTIQALLEDSSIFGGDGFDSIRVGSSNNALIDAGSDDLADSIEIKAAITRTRVLSGGGNDSISIRGAYAVNSVFDGGAGDADIILLFGSKSSYGLTLLGDAGTGFFFRDKNNTEYRNLELLAFSDGTVTAGQLIAELSTAAATPPPTIGDQADEETLRTDISPAEWISRNYDALVFRGISGTEVRDVTIRTGSGNNRVSLNDALAFAALDTGDGDDLVRIDTQPARDQIKPFVQFGRAVYNADISLGNGDDILNAQSDGNAGGYVPGSPLDGPGYSNPDYFQSTIDAGSGNDYIYGFLPYASTFDGGIGTDTLLLYGTRADWDLEFIYDINGNLNYILAAGIGDFNISKDNKIRNFEFIQFNDVLLNLASPPPDNSLDFFGQDLLTRTLPELNSSVTAPLWDGLAFNRLNIAAVKGLPTALISIDTGVGNDTPSIEGNVEDATFNLGDGDDVFKAGTVLRSTIQGQGGKDYIQIKSIKDSTIIAGLDNGSDDDVIEINAEIENTTIRAGGGRDRLLLQGTFSDGIVNNPNAVDSSGVSYYQLGNNRFYSFEEVTFLNSPTLNTTPINGSTGGGNTSGGGGSSSGGNTNPSSTTEAQVAQLPSGGLLITAAPISPTPQNLIGTLYDDIINGGNNPDILRSRAGRDQLRGGGSADRFQYSFASGREFLSGDRVLDFTPGADKLEILDVAKRSSLGKLLKGKQPSNKTVQTVESVKEAKKANAVFVYASENGSLFYNPNLENSGFGKGGGLIAELSLGLRLSGSDLTINYL